MAGTGLLKVRPCLRMWILKLEQYKDPLVIDCVPLKLRELIHMNKIAVQFYMFLNLIELKKLKYTILLKNKLQQVDLMLDYRLLKES